MAVPPEAPKPGCILFIIPFPSDAVDPASFELEIPLDDLNQLVLRPVRWLKLVAWGVSNCTGRVLDANDFPLDEDMLLDQLSVPNVYTFVPDHVGNFSLLNFEHVRTGRSDRSSASSDSDAHDSYLPDQEAAMAERDGGKCVFTRGSPIAMAQFIPRRFGRNLEELRNLAHERGFAFDHHLDIRNRITLGGDICRSWQVHKQVFILATDPSFVRKQDIPPPIPPHSPAAETYILQTLDRLLGAHSNLRKYVPFNTGARFASSAGPCPRAVNYVYAAAMVCLYCRTRRDVLSRPLPVVGTVRRRRRPAELTPVEKLYLLADEPAVRRRLREEDEDAARRVEEWRDHLAATHSQ